MEVLTTFCLFYIMIELSFKPRVDAARDGYYLWYGTRKRKFIKLW